MRELSPAANIASEPPVNAGLVYPGEPKHRRFHMMHARSGYLVALLGLVVAVFAPTVLSAQCASSICSPTPEPSTLLLMVPAGAAAAMFLRARLKSKK
jgi:hypothetical protein